RANPLGWRSRSYRPPDPVAPLGSLVLTLDRDCIQLRRLKSTRSVAATASISTIAKRIAESPLQLADPIEVHAVDAAGQCRCEQDRRPRGGQCVGADPAVASGSALGRTSRRAW